MTEETEKSPAAEEPEAQPKAQKRLSPEQWGEIERHWEHETMRVKEICSHYGISPQAIRQHMTANPHIKKGSKAHLVKAAVAAPVGAAATVPSDFEAKKKERIEQTKEAIYRSSNANAALFGRLQKEIVDGTRTLEGTEKAFKALRVAEGFLKLSRDNRYAVLDIANDINEQDLPVLVFEDLTQDEIRKIQEGDDNDLDSILADLPDEDDGVVEEGKPT